MGRLHHAAAHHVLYASDAYPGRIYKLTLDGKLLGTIGSAGRQFKQSSWVQEIACPSENTLYIAELLSWRIQKLLLHPRRKVATFATPEASVQV